MSANITERAMTVTLSISQWRGVKTDKKATQELAREKGADLDSIHVVKQIVTKQAVDEFVKISTEARTFFYANTLPWFYSNTNIISSANVLKFLDEMRKIERRWQGAVNKFFTVYEDLRTDAERRLNGLFNKKDYPTLDELRGKFSWRVEIATLPNAADFRVNLAADDAAKIKKQIEDGMRESMRRAMGEVWERLATVLNKLVDKMREKDGIFHDTLITNIADLCEVLPGLNITDDKRLDDMIKKVQARFASINPDELREYKQAERNAVAKEASELLDKISEYAGAF